MVNVTQKDIKNIIMRKCWQYVLIQKQENNYDNNDNDDFDDDHINDNNDDT